MATVGRGRLPAIPTPRGLDAKVIEQAVNNIRERLAFADNDITQLRALIEGNKSGQSITLLQTRLTQLSAQVAALTQLVNGLTSDDEEPADNSPAEIAELRKLIDDQAPSNPLQAELAELAKRVNSLEQGVLP